MHSSGRILVRGLAVLALAACGGGDSTSPVTPPAAAALHFVGSASNVVAGSFMAPFTVEVVDANGVRVENSPRAITVSVIAPAGMPASAPSGHSVDTTVQGTATFDQFQLTVAGTGYRLQASAAGLTSAQSGIFDVAPDVASRLLVMWPVSGVRVGANIPAISATVRDRFDNLASAVVTAALDSGPPGAALLGTTSVATVASVATFTDLHFAVPGTGFRLRFTVPGNPAGQVGAAFAVGAKLKILDAVTFDTLGASPTLHVEIQDDAGQSLPAASALVQVSVIGGPAVQPTSVTRSAATVAGVAAVTIQPARVGTGYRFVASAPGFDADTSAPFTARFYPVETSTGSLFTCSRSAGGHVMCVGDNHAQTLGAGAPDTVELQPILLRSSARFSQVAMGGGQQACALTAAGAAWCWGLNGDGQLGIGVTGGTRDSAVAVAGGHAFTVIRPAMSGTCGLATDSLAYCWGMDIYGTLGTGTPGSVNVPTPVAGGHHFASLSGGFQHACALTAAGDAWCWGLAIYGQLGDPTIDYQTVTGINQPVHAAAGHQFTAIAASQVHTCALDASGHAWCWGFSAFLGNPAVANVTTFVDTAVAVAGGLSFNGLWAGTGVTCGRVANGDLYCWGRAAYGQIGDGGFGPAVAATPTLVSGGHAWQQVSVGWNHTCGIAGGELWCWGWDGSGQLGDGPPRADAAIPTQAIR